MKIEDTYYGCELEDVLDELISQMQANGLPYLQKGYKRSGDSLQVQCPYHSDGQERKPSFGIRRSDGMGHCFACGKVVTLPEFITQCFDKDDILGEFGRRWLRRNFMSLEVEERKDVGLDLSRNRYSSRVNRDCSSNTVKCVGEEELDRYRYYHEYWGKRGITDEGIIELFDLGFDKDTNCITMPVRDKDGNCLFVARRSVQTKFFNYPEGVEKPLYGLYELYNWSKYPVSMNVGDIGQLIVCESMIDCILLWQAGHYAVALNGLGNALQMQQLRELSYRHIILATDNDEAGYGARQRLHKALSNKLITEIQFPNNRKDIGECTQDEIQNILEWEKVV